jgi:hypothetical protein
MTAMGIAAEWLQFAGSGLTVNPTLFLHTPFCSIRNSEQATSAEAKNIFGAHPQ